MSNNIKKMDQKAKIPTTLNINSKDTAICDDKILNIQSSKIPTIKKSLVMTARSEATDSDNTRIRIGPTKKSTLPIAKSPLKPLIPIQQNIPVPKITTTFIINSESTQIHDLSLPTTPNWLQKDAKKSSVPKPTSKVVSIAKDAVYDEKIVNTILSSKIPTVKKSLVMTAKSEATESYYPRTRIGPSKKSTLPIAKTPLKPLIPKQQNIQALPRSVFKAIENLGSTVIIPKNKINLISSTPILTANRLNNKTNEELGKNRYSLSNIELTKIHRDGADKD